MDLMCYVSHPWLLFYPGKACVCLTHKSYCSDQQWILSFSCHQRSPSRPGASGSGSDSSKVCCHCGCEQTTDAALWAGWRAGESRRAEHLLQRERCAAKIKSMVGEFEKKLWAVSKRHLGSSLRDEETVRNEGIKVLQKMNRWVYKEIARYRHASQTGKERKNWQPGEERGKLKMTQQTGKKKKRSSSTAIWENMERGQEMQQGLQKKS